MRFRRRAHALVAAFGLLSMVIGGCSDDDDSGNQTVTSVEVTGSHGVAVGDTITLQAATVNGSDSGYTWISSNAAVATVSEAGVVTGVGVGEAEITATGAQTGVTGRHAVVVTPTGSSEPAVVISGPHGVSEGETITLDASTLNGADSGYTWASSDTAVATVSTSGVVTGVAAGEALISATGADTAAEGTHAVVVIEVVDPATPVIRVTGDVFLRVGATATYAAVTVNGTDASYDWSSSDALVASVDAGTGAVIAHSPGQVVLTAVGADTGESGTFTVQVSLEIPNEDEWLTSGHGDYAAHAFRYWDASGSIPASCAKCHSGAGFDDYLGADGSTAFLVDAAHAPGRTVDCNACHSPTAQALSKVIFPSGVEVSGLGGEAKCMTCHQGRESTDSVNTKITNAAPATDDTVVATLTFSNIHYYAAGASLMGGRTRGGYQYSGQKYDWRFRHVPGYDNCQGCHDPHTLEVKVDECGECHTGVATLADLRTIRTITSLGQDYDGDGDTAEGIDAEISGLRTKLYAAIQDYAAEAAGADHICYSPDSHPYWFVDTDANGTCEATEAVSANSYKTFTARLLRAAYNYQVSKKDPGAFAHNAKYTIQLLHDSIADLNTALSTPVDMAAAVRDDVGHFNGASQPFRYWDSSASVSTSCVKCHSGSEGFRFFLDYGVNKMGVEQANGLDCATCHNDLSDPSLLVAVSTTTFPSDVKVNLQTATGDTTSNVCGTCHSGRVGKATIDAYTGTSFQNVHYLPAAGVRAGTSAKVGYEYLGKTYVGASTRHGACISCHKPGVSNHSFRVDDGFTSGADGTLNCSGCHSGTSVATGNFRVTRNSDYDGDGNTSETLGAEIAGLAHALEARMTAFALASSLPDLCYYGEAHPYWYIRNVAGTGECDPSNGFTTADRYVFTGAAGKQLMQAAHNLQIWHKEPGAWAHNFEYMVQLLIDSIEDLGGDVSGYVRP